MDKKRNPPLGLGKEEGRRRQEPLPGPGMDRPRKKRAVSSGVAALALLLALTSLTLTILSGGFRSPTESIREFFREPTPHEAYLLGLSQSGLATSALAQDWMVAARSALAGPLQLELPYQEEVFFSPDEAMALGYRISLRRGQRLSVDVEVNGARETRVFLDLFRSAPDTLRPPVHVLSPPENAPLVFEPRRGGEYILRVQPELLRGGRIRVVIDNNPALAFPVSGRSHRAIGSFFGDPRDGGSRRHHGVDIFAPRGTPVVASSDAYVRRTDTTNIGGRVIWLSDSRRNASLYYAHLHEILVEEGSRVRAGDTIGTVGNTGNARTTPPHLHFGLYLRGEGPYDPWDFLYRNDREMPEVQVATGGLGGWFRVRGDEISLRDRPSPGGSVLTRLPPHTALRLMGGVRQWYRVRIPDGTQGFVAGRLTEAAGDPLWLEEVAEVQALRSEPLAGAPVMGEVPVGTELSVLGTFGDFLFVQSGAGRPGWVMRSVASSM